MKRSLLFKALFAALLVPCSLYPLKGPGVDAYKKVVERVKKGQATFTLAELIELSPAFAFIGLGPLEPAFGQISFTFQKPQLKGMDKLYIPGSVQIPKLNLSAKVTVLADFKVKPEKIAEKFGEALFKKYIKKEKEVTVKGAVKEGAKEAFGVTGVSVLIEMPGDQFNLAKIHKSLNLMPFKGKPGSKVFIVLSNHDYQSKDLDKMMERNDVQVKQGITFLGDMVTAGPIEKLIGSNTLAMEGFFPKDPKGVGAYIKGRIAGDKKIVGKLRLKEVAAVFKIPAEAQFFAGLEATLQTPLPLQDKPVDMKGTVGLSGKPGAVIARLEGDMIGEVSFPKVRGMKLQKLHVEGEIDIAKLPTPAAIRSVGYKGTGSFFGKGITYGVLGGVSEKAAAIAKFEGGLFLHEIVELMGKAVGKNLNVSKLPKMGVKEAQMSFATVATQFGDDQIPAGIASTFVGNLLGKDFGMTALVNRDKGEISGTAFVQNLKLGPLSVSAFEAGAAGPIMSLAVGPKRQAVTIEGNVMLDLLDGLGARSKVELASDGMIIDITPKIFPKVTNFDGRVKVVTVGGITKKPEKAEIEIWINGADKLLTSGINLANKAAQLAFDGAKKATEFAKKRLGDAEKGMKAAQAGVKQAEAKVAGARQAVANERNKVAAKRRALDISSASKRRLEDAARACAG